MAGGVAEKSAAGRNARVRQKFDDAGIELYALNYSFREEWGDEELEAAVSIARRWA